MLLEAVQDGDQMSNSDLQEEVNTFMFEGRDTTSSGIGFTLSSSRRSGKPNIVTRSVRLRPLALSSASIKPILCDGWRKGEMRVVASQPTKVSFRAKKNRWITEIIDGAS
uniref:Uncharacterized protein n=1 Tax=Timema genevievae TaxID=629358 RepID=A0A7R9K8H2_TIMGE|nr:unnamed protein product [Timema genevievae]